MARVICAGHCNWDVTLRVDDLPEPDGEATVREETGARGGSAANVASVLAGLGVDPAILASVGDDDHGAAALADLRAAGVDCGHVRVLAGATTSVKYCVVADDGRVMVLGHDGRNEAYDPSDLPAETLAGAACLHLTGQAPETAAGLARRGREAGLPVTFDPGRRITRRDYADAIGLADLVFVNRAEADALDLDALAAGAIGGESATRAPIDGFERAADRSAVARTDATPGRPAVVVKRGASGAELRTPDGRRDVHPGFAVDPVDTTGAGDAFAAGYLAARLDGEPIPAALARANACGALAARSVGPSGLVSPGAVADLLAGETASSR